MPPRKHFSEMRNRYRTIQIRIIEVDKNAVDAYNIARVEIVDEFRQRRAIIYFFANPS